MIGSAVYEIGSYEKIFMKATEMLSDNGELYYSSVDKKETSFKLTESLKDTNYAVSDYKRLEKYGLVLILSKIIKS